MLPWYAQPQSQEISCGLLPGLLCGLQVVQFMTNASSIDPQRLPYKLNSLLPHDIRISWMAQTAPDFNVTVTAKHKVRSGCAAAD